MVGWAEEAGAADEAGGAADEAAAVEGSTEGWAEEGAAAEEAGASGQISRNEMMSATRGHT